MTEEGFDYLAFADEECEMSDNEHLKLPAVETVHPNSPMPHASSRGPSRFPGTPRLPGHYSLCDLQGNSAYNIMQKWNLKFSGARGENAETFLLRIEKGRELIPVTEENILRCLPFVLTDLTRYIDSMESAIGC